MNCKYCGIEQEKDYVFCSIACADKHYLEREWSIPREVVNQIIQDIERLRHETQGVSPISKG